MDIGPDKCETKTKSQRMPGRNKKKNKNVTWGCFTMKNKMNGLVSWNEKPFAFSLVNPLSLSLSLSGPYLCIQRPSLLMHSLWTISLI